MPNPAVRPMTKALAAPNHSTNSVYWWRVAWPALFSHCGI